MRKIFILIIFISGYNLIFSQTFTEFQDPKVFEINKLYPRANIIPDHEFYKISLNGIWKFNFVQHTFDRPIDFYKVDFETGWNVDHEIWYNAEGKMVKHKEDISKIELPKTVTDRIKTDFNGYTIDDLKRITDNGKIVYKMELNALMKRDWNVVIDTNGNVLSKMAD